jgi:hypothetical protein
MSPGGSQLAIAISIAIALEKKKKKKCHNVDVAPMILSVVSKQ